MQATSDTFFEVLQGSPNRQPDSNANASHLNIPIPIPIPRPFPRPSKQNLNQVPLCAEKWQASKPSPQMPELQACASTPVTCEAWIISLSQSAPIPITPVFLAGQFGGVMTLPNLQPDFAQMAAIHKKEQVARKREQHRASGCRYRERHKERALIFSQQARASQAKNRDLKIELKELTLRLTLLHEEVDSRKEELQVSLKLHP